MVRLSRAHGVLVVDKPRGPTSHDIVAQARRLYGTRAVGHAGTLDPLATGVLLLAFGEATKLVAYLTAESKQYRAVVRFGVATDTLDAAGNCLDRMDLPPGWLDASTLQAALSSERERVLQSPPAFSAIKVDGQRAHRLSRKGELVELAPRAVSVERLELLDLEHDAAVVELRVSKGYYVRSFARDLGQALGVPAHLSELRRVASGGFTLTEATPWPALAAVPLMPLETAAERVLPRCVLTSAGELRARRGQALTAEDFCDEGCWPEARPVAAWVSGSGDLVAVGRRDGDACRVVRGFTQPPSANVELTNDEPLSAEPLCDASE